MFEQIHNWEIGFLYFIQEFRGPYLDIFFKFLNYFDTDLFSFILIPMVYGIWGAKWGARVFFLDIISGILNYDFKILFSQPRPTSIDSTLGLVHFHSYGFPSGGAQTAILLGGLGFTIVKSPIAKAFFLGYFLLISFSRLYLGAHFPSDILGGWLLGLIILCGYLRYHDKIETWIGRRSKKELFILAWIFPAIFLSFNISGKTFIYASSFLGFNLGLLYMKDRMSSSNKIANAVVGVMGILSIVYIAHLFLPVDLYTLRALVLLSLTYFLLPLWITVATPSLTDKVIVPSQMKTR